MAEFGGSAKMLRQQLNRPLGVARDRRLHDRPVLFALALPSYRWAAREVAIAVSDIEQLLTKARQPGRAACADQAGVGGTMSSFPCGIDATVRRALYRDPRAVCAKGDTWQE